MEKIYGLDLSYHQWVELLESLGEPSYRADQICQWIYQKGVDSFEGMTNLSKNLRPLLEDKVDVVFPARLKTDRSRDGTKKMLWGFRDGASAESVFLRHGRHRTACLSSQVGCPLECVFCATGEGGFQRNLSPGEMVGHFLAMERAAEEPIQNIVFMGMGEPLLNEENLFKAVAILNHPKMRHLGIRHITVSTVGVVPGIEKMARIESPPRLAVSLHTVDESLRSELMPVNRIHPLKELKKALFAYQESTGDRITLEYLLLRGINDTPEDARALAAWIRGLHAFVNLIPYNQSNPHFAPSYPEKAALFQKVLEEKDISVEVRRSHGSDIAAACGQLRQREQNLRQERQEKKAQEETPPETVSSRGERNSLKGNQKFGKNKKVFSQRSFHKGKGPGKGRSRRKSP